jgi:transcriptional regulator with AAA-type ATPase domain
MRFLTGPERTFLQAVSRLAYCNPFLPERVEHERQALGPLFVEGEPVWSLRVENPEEPRVNAWRIHEQVETLAPELRRRLLEGAPASEADHALYEDAVLYWLYYRYTNRLYAAAFDERRAGWGFYRQFRSDWQEYFELPDVALPTGHQPAHTFACFCQILRAFYHIFTHIVGNSMPAARLRAGVWQSIFTHDVRRYRRSLYDRMSDFPTLITGPSGTGKELVARAIARSRYVPFDESKLAFAADLSDAFYPINLSALAATLIESELFGHRRGAFTGAWQDRRGWLESCPAYGTVFLDEIGDVDLALQVKLLRVIDTRTFHAVGDTAVRRFQGKLIAATNRDLAEAMAQGRFREDFYYRLCADQIVTPTLRDQLRHSPGALREAILFVAQQVGGPEAEALAAEAEAWIRAHLGEDYTWPGNFRELAQCVRNIVVRNEYRPARRSAPQPRQDLAAAVNDGSLSVEELLSRYCTLVYAQSGSYEEAARRLGVDRRTVKNKVKPELLAQFRNSST